MSDLAAGAVDGISPGPWKTDPLELLSAALGSGMPINPLAALTDYELYWTQVMLQLACLRSHSPLTKDRREFFCAMGRVLQVESNLRGVPYPTAPFHAPSKADLAL